MIRASNKSSRGAQFFANPVISAELIFRGSINLSAEAFLARVRIASLPQSELWYGFG